VTEVPLRPLRIEGTPYGLLRYLTLPVVAVTSSENGRGNGMIANGAQRASLVPTVPRIAIFINKTNFTHGLVYRTGAFGIHLLRQDQWELIWRLGFASGRDQDKMAGLEVQRVDTGIPLLVDVRAAFECRVVNTMDSGGATCFLGDVVSVFEGTAGPVMTSDHFRDNMPADRKRMYESLLALAQEKLERMSHQISPVPWPGPVSRP
jgi:flavin reductase (DIM6/NTAB) family NADH-FMN oxidoreductase RutF